MKFRSTLLITSVSVILTACTQQDATIKLSQVTLMHEKRATSYPLNNAVINDRCVSLQWPLPPGAETSGELLDGVTSSRKKTDKNLLKYQVRYSKDPSFKNSTSLINVNWPFHNPANNLEPGEWYWQYGYVKEGITEWSEVLHFTVEQADNKFCPPSLESMLDKLPGEHPRVWVSKAGWDGFRRQAEGKPEYQWYIERAEIVLRTPMKTLKDINMQLADNLTDMVKRKAMITRESRRIVDQEESNTEALIRAYLLTKEEKYFTESMKRVTEMAEWGKDKNVIGDFNAATMLSLCSMAYDSFYDLLNEAQKELLLDKIKEYGNDFFADFNNRLENHIADNHVWQMTLRIFTMAAFSVYGELPEADVWTDYCYNLWLARFPGLNKDGGWHNGDSYFSVNTRTLIEVPYFYSQITGFDFFKDPWYQGSIDYTIYMQPPFSHGSGNGSSHRKVTSPRAPRVSYADALARLTGNTYAADYVRRILNQDPQYLKKAHMAKAGDLAWFRLQCNKPLPQGKGLQDLPLGHFFPQTGIAAIQSNWTNIDQNAMLTFRSSPYGSTSHALANQNAFNTYYGGKPLFYSSGHHIEFTDKHSLYCHRGTRGHNTILVNGMGQRIGTEGYGWIPRYYTGKKIDYVLGDASNAYGEVISQLWLERGKVSGLEFSPANGWDKNHLNTFRRHIVALEGAALIFIYDELEADTAVSWNYLLHTAFEKMDVAQTGNHVHIRAKNDKGESDAWLFSSGKLETEQIDQFFQPAINWLRADAQGNFEPLENHYHFTATTAPQQVYRFATLISTHAKGTEGITPLQDKDGTIHAGKWTIKVNLSTSGKPSFSIKHNNDDTAVIYNTATIVREGGSETKLTDKLPELEI